MFSIRLPAVTSTASSSVAFSPGAALAAASSVAFWAGGAAVADACCAMTAPLESKPSAAAMAMPIRECLGLVAVLSVLMPLLPGN